MGVSSAAVGQMPENTRSSTPFSTSALLAIDPTPDLVSSSRSATPVVRTPAARRATQPPPVAPAEPVNGKLWLCGSGALALLVLLWLRYRQDTYGGSPDLPKPGYEPEAETYIAAPPLRATANMRGAWLTLALRPVRAGLNLITAVADCEITIANEGSAPAGNIRAAVALVAAFGGEQDDIRSLDAEPIMRPLVPAFTLQPGEARTFRGVASAILDDLPTLQAGGRDMLMPLVVLNVQLRDAAGAEHRISQGFVIGVERVDSPKLAPFWLDFSRMIEQVAARPRGAPRRWRMTA